MHVRKIQISNVRGFREVDLDLTRPDGSLAGWTVLAGRNGSGKSTLLKAIALAVAGPEAARALYPSFADWMRSGSQEAAVGVHLALSPEEPQQLQETRLSWSRQEESEEPILLERPQKLRNVEEILRRLKEGEQFFLDREVLKPGTIWQSVLQPPLRQVVSAQREQLFLAAYGPYRRLSGHAADAQRLMDGTEPIARVVSLFREDSSLVESVGWLREVYLQRLENKPGAADLEKSVLALLDDGLLPDSVRVDQVDSEGLWVFQREVRLPLRELSDGYRTVAALVMDVVRHLHRTFGTLQVEEAIDAEGSFRRVSHQGVVLIDEVDLHLHVSWQQRIGFWLKRHFPNIQFIVTTHSPFICQAADPGGLIRLPAPGEERSVEHVSEDLYNTVVHGGLDDAVLSELFGLDSPYSEETERLRAEVARLEAALQTGRGTDFDRARLQELRAQLPRTMSSSVEQALRALAVEG
jgi:predicted ATP-binding protein involved in virulence